MRRPASHGSRHAAHPCGPRSPHAGLTLVELLVAMFLTTLVILAAVGTLGMARQGLGSVDAAAQLRDNARFAVALIQQLAAQAGYKDLYDATYAQQTPAGQPFDVQGYETPLSVHGADNGAVGEHARVNDSDLLTLRAMVSARHEVQGLREADSASEGNRDSDQSMVNCLGIAPDRAPSSVSTWIRSDLFLRRETVDAEPAIFCRAYGADGQPLPAQSLIRGVETFQVLYGVNTASNPNALADDAATFQFKTASEIEQAGQWRQVRSLRIGMVLRSSTAAVPERRALTYHPLGEAYAAAAGGRFEAAADGRLRQVATFTIQLRNAINR